MVWNVAEMFAVRFTALGGGPLERYGHSPRWVQVFSMTAGWSGKAPLEDTVQL